MRGDAAAGGGAAAHTRLLAALRARFMRALPRRAAAGSDAGGAAAEEDGGNDGGNGGRGTRTGDEWTWRGAARLDLALRLMRVGPCGWGHVGGAATWVGRFYW